MAAIPAPARDPSLHSNDGQTGLVRAPRVEIVAITSDDRLLEQIGQALDGESIVRHADSPAEARAIATPRQPCVVLLDARGHEDLAPVVEGLQSPDGTRVVVVFAPAEASDDVARAVRGSAAFAVLTIPVAQVQTAAVLGGAREESLARHALLTQPSPSPATGVAEAAPVVTGDATSPDAERFISQARIPRKAQVTSGATRGSRKPLFFASLVLLALIVAGAAWYGLREPGGVDGPSAAPQPAAAETTEAPTVESVPTETLQSGSIDELLDSARAAMRERRYTDPEGQNALNFYRSALAQEPDNGEALEGLERVAAVLLERAESAVEQRKFDEANRTLTQLRSIRPDDPAVARLTATVVDARIRRAMEDPDGQRARELLQQAAKAGTLPPDVIGRWQSELDRRQGDARVEQLASLVSLRIRQGRLLEPATDSAKHYLGQLRRLPGDAQQRAASATKEMQQACLAEFKDALAKSQRAQADRWKAEARALGVTAAEIAALERQVTARVPTASAPKPELTRIVQLIQERIADNRLVEPVGDSAVFHLNTLRAQDPSSAAVAASEQSLSAKLLSQGRTALTERRLETARTHAAAARQLGLNLDTVAALERDIAAAGPASEGTGPRSKPNLVRTRYVAPEYPAGAFKHHLQGNVRVRITVDAEGRVRDAAIVESNPPGVFDSAAVAAVRKWRFKPLGDEDSDVSATAVVDIAFRTEDAKQ